MRKVDKKTLTRIAMYNDASGRKIFSIKNKYTYA